MCDVGLLSLEILPIDAALNLFMCGPPSAKHSLTKNLLNSKSLISFFFLKFETAENTIFSIADEAFDLD